MIAAPANTMTTQTPTPQSEGYATISAMTGHAPRPPRHLEDAMADAGAKGDTTRLNALKSAYELWALAEHGYWPHHATGSPVPDEVWE